MDPKKIIFTPYPCSGAIPSRDYQNVIFEIDASEFPNFTTVIQKHQSKFTDEEAESLISCYNIYSWQGFEGVKYHPNEQVPDFYVPIPLVKLKIENYTELHDVDTARILGCSSALDETWLGKKGDIVKTRGLTSDTLINALGSLWDSYDRAFGFQKSSNSLHESHPLTWLNAPFKTNDSGDIKQYVFEANEEYPQLPSGELLDGKAFLALEQKQAKEKNTKTVAK
jgi:hypothetical protein